MFAHAFAALLLIASSVHGLALPEPVPGVPTIPDRSAQGITCGTAKYFMKGFGGSGSCGVPITTNDYIGGLSAKFEPGTNFCGKKIQVWNSKKGTNITVTLEDICTDCELPNIIELNQAAFEAVGGYLGAGPIDVTGIPPKWGVGTWVHVVGFCLGWVDDLLRGRFVDDKRAGILDVFIFVERLPGKDS